jgi:hypothetical protein
VPIQTETRWKRSPITAEPADIKPPKHPLHAQTTFELSGYRRQLERAIAFFGTKDPVPPVRATLQADLAAVIAEQADRKKLAGA